MRSAARRSLTAVVLLAPLAAGVATACPGAPGVRCNTDLDCPGDEACTYGLCRPIEDAVDLDAGAPDGGSADAGFPDAGCPADQHEGGLGCVPLDACSPGFTFAYVDGDEDGVGAGDVTGGCVAEPLPVGLARTGDDCDDGDAQAFRIVDGFGDDDGDSYTTGPRSDCAGDVLPQGMVAVERLGPVLLTEAATFVNADGFQNTWNDRGNVARCCGEGTFADVDSTVGTAPLLLTGFACSAAPERIEVVRVHLRGRLAVGNDDDDQEGVVETLGVSVTIGVDGVPGATRTTMATWTEDDADFYVEGTAAEWGIAPLPEDACDGSLSVGVVVEPNGAYGAGVVLDFVTVEIEGVTDCAPDDGARFARVDVYDDADGDGRHGTFLGPCHDDAPLVQPDARLREEDCDDGDDRVFPGQSATFAVPRPSGSFDYDCDGTETRVNVTDVTGCTQNPDAGTCEQSTRTVSGACGEEVDDDFCSSSCALQQGTSPIRCR